MDEIQLLDGFRGEAFATLPCQDGGGSIARYPRFDGVNALLRDRLKEWYYDEET